MNEEQSHKKLAFLKNQVDFILGNDFDSIQIFASKFDKVENTTHYWSQGNGNYAARYGQAKLWVLQEESDQIKDK